MAGVVEEGEKEKARNGVEMTGGQVGRLRGWLGRRRGSGVRGGVGYR